jgi:hypothetical protein
MWHGIKVQRCRGGEEASYWTLRSGNYKHSVTFIYRQDGSVDVVTELWIGRPTNQASIFGRDNRKNWMDVNGSFMPRPLYPCPRI